MSGDATGTEPVEPDSRAGDEPDRFVPTVGFVIAGFGLASGFLRWTEAVAVGPVESVPGVVAALIALLAFAGRRYGFAARRSGAGGRRYAILAGFGFASLAWAAAVALLYPFATGTQEPALGPGIPIAFLLGVVGLGVAYADYLGLPRNAFLTRSRFAAGALSIGFIGLLVGQIVGLWSASIVPGAEPLTRSGVMTVGFSIGLGIVALGFLAVTGRDRSFIDVAWLTRRDWAYVVGGVVAMYVVLIGLSVLVSVLGLPSAQHGLIESARDNPEKLLLFIPLSWLAIGPGEELLNRNIIQKYLYDAYSRRAAVVVGTIVFTLIHLPAYATGPAAAVFTTLLRLFGISLVLGVVYERTENVVVAALVHGTYNAIQFGLAYVSLTSGLL